MSDYPELSRRQFLITSAAVAGTALVPSVAYARDMDVWRMMRLHRQWSMQSGEATA